MEDLINHPFLLSLQQAANQTDNYHIFQSLLEEQQIMFKEYVCSNFNSGLPAPKRYHFLRIAEYLLNKISKNHAEQIKENTDFYKFWTSLIDDARTYVQIGIETLKFQTRCPAHMLSEPVQSFPACVWTANKIDLMELFVGVYQIDAIRLQDGSRPAFPLFVQSVGNVFGITFDDPKKEASRVIARKKNATPFFDRIVTILKNKNQRLSM